MRKLQPNYLSKRGIALLIQEALDLPMDWKANYPHEGAKILNAILSTMVSALQRGEEIYINGFGKFKIVAGPNRNLHNIILSHDPIFSPVPIEIKGRKKVIFSPATQLMAMLNPNHPNYSQREAMKIWNK